MATFETHQKLTNALGEERAEAVAEYFEDGTRELATRADLTVLRADLVTLRAEIGGDLYRALWIQGGIIVTAISAVVGASAAVVTALG